MPRSAGWESRGKLDARLLLALFVAAALCWAAWVFADRWGKKQFHSTLSASYSVMGDYSFAEYVRTTARVNLANPRGRRHTVEFERGTGPEAVGVLSRPGETPAFTYLIGERPSFFVDVVEPVDRYLTMAMASETDAQQSMELLFNGHSLGSTRLRRDRQTGAVRLLVPAALQVPGRNRVQWIFEQVQPTAISGVEGELPLAARVLTVRFLPPNEELELVQGEQRALDIPQAGLVSGADGKTLTELELPGGTSAIVALKLPEGRVGLRYVLSRLALPLELWALPDGEQPFLLLRSVPGASGPGSVAADLTPWAGEAVRLEFRAALGEGTNSVQGVALIVPDGHVGQEQLGQLEILRDGALPALTWTEGSLRLELDLSTRRRQLFDLATDPQQARDLSYSRPALGAWAYQRLCQDVKRTHAGKGWLAPLKVLLMRQ